MLFNTNKAKKGKTVVAFEFRASVEYEAFWYNSTCDTSI